MDNDLPQELKVVQPLNGDVCIFVSPGAFMVIVDLEKKLNEVVPEVALISFPEVSALSNLFCFSFYQSHRCPLQPRTRA